MVIVALYAVTLHAINLLVVAIIVGPLSKPPPLNLQMRPDPFLLVTHKVWHTSLHSQDILPSVFSLWNGTYLWMGGKTYKTYLFAGHPTISIQFLEGNVYIEC